MVSPRCLRCKVKNLNSRELMQRHRNQFVAIIGNCIVKSFSQANYTHLKTDFRFWSLLLPVEKILTSCTAKQKPFNFQSTFIYSPFIPNVLLLVMFFHINSSSFFSSVFTLPFCLQMRTRTPLKLCFFLVKQASLFLITCNWKDASLP